MTKLHDAIDRRNPWIFKTVLASNYKDVNTRKNGWTPLHLAVYSGNTKIVKILMKYKIEAMNDASSSLPLLEIDRKDCDGMTPLHLAVETNRIKIAELLLTNHADMFIKDDDDMTPLDRAHSDQMMKLFDLHRKDNKEPEFV